jgi:hypothetical protein
MFMQEKRMAGRLLGIMAIVGGSLLVGKVSWNLIRSAGYSLEGYIIDFWYLLVQIWLLALGSYFISIGLRKYRASKTGKQTKKQRIGWGRILIGSFLMISTINNRLHPVHNRWELKPDNEAQASAMKATETFLTFFMPVLGAWLIFAGVRAGFKKPVEAQVERIPTIQSEEK